MLAAAPGPAATRRLGLAPATDVAATVRSAAVGRHDPTLRLDADGLWWACPTPDGPATVQVTWGPGQACAAAWGPGAAAALERVPGLLGQGDDPAALVTDHPLVADLARRRPGLRLPRTGTLAAALPAAVLGQRVTGRQARDGWRAVVQRWGAPAPGPGEARGLRLAPAPGVLAEVGYADLHPLGIERHRAEALRATSARAARLDRLLDARPAEAVAALATLPGIGPWTATSAVAVATGDPDVVVVGDLHLPSLVTWALAGERRGDDARMLELLAPFAGQRARVVRLLAAGRHHPPRRAPRRAIPPIERW